MDLVPVHKWGKGKWERRTGTKLLAVFIQHICSKVNTLKGVANGLGMGKGCYGEGYRAPRSALRGSRPRDGQGLQVAPREHRGRVRGVRKEPHPHALQERLRRVRGGSYGHRRRRRV